MFKHLLVPLDGSQLAETVLPAVVYLARVTGATVTLLHVIERDAPQQVHGERHLTNADDACIYLGEIAERAFPPEMRPDIVEHVHTVEVGNVAQSIMEHVGEFAPDLIVLCSHGSGGLRDFLYGSIAQQVIAIGKTPVLVIEPASKTPDAGYRRMLVPLDGDPDHEQGIATVTDLAKACGASLHLLVVVRTTGTLTPQQAATGRLLPSTMNAMLELAQEDAVAYLQDKLSQLQAEGITASAEVARGDPAAAIAITSERIGADLIVLGTHGKAGWSAFWAGSIAPKIADRARRHLLLAPVHAA
jgi:nucleotide-binding universal stress UspA family protein